MPKPMQTLWKIRQGQDAPTPLQGRKSAKRWLHPDASVCATDPDRALICAHGHAVRWGRA